MGVSNYSRVKLWQLANLVIAWAIICAIISWSDYILFKATEYLPPMHFPTFLMTNIVGITSAGLAGGALFIFLLRPWFARKTYGFGIIMTILIVTALFVLIAFVILNIYMKIVLGLPFFSVPGLRETMNFMSTPLIWQRLVLWLFIVGATQFIFMINDKFGQGILKAFLLGKYHHAQDENRIFMFLDLTSSTTIAEDLGSSKFYNFLNDFYADITKPIINSSGEIYQYVGDEVIVSWQMKKGIKNSNCVKCFFDIEKQIAKLNANYIVKYGYAPQFKAAIHCGKVTIGEIGVIKKELVFTGDTLNTTARILEQCNRYKKRLLVSTSIYRIIKDDPSFMVTDIGSLTLRGKQEQVEIFAVDLAEEVGGGKATGDPEKAAAVGKTDA